MILPILEPLDKLTVSYTVRVWSPRPEDSPSDTHDKIERFTPMMRARLASHLNIVDSLYTELKEKILFRSLRLLTYDHKYDAL